MVRAPYPARIAAGLLVTAIEETRKLPTLVVTLPMTAVSQTLQAGMRLQQNIAELAIKGDSALEMIFDKPTDQPEWARFDDDELSAANHDHYPHPATIVERNPEPDTTSDADPDNDDPDNDDSGNEDTDATRPGAATGRFALYSSTPLTATIAQETQSPTTQPSTTQSPTAAAPAKKTAAKKTAAKKAPATKAPAQTGETADTGGTVAELDYDSLTLAQLRAKIRTLGLTELEDLAAHERANKGRAPFITMLDNRISAKTK